jgi:hypothetical protein
LRAPVCQRTVFLGTGRTQGDTPTQIEIQVFIKEKKG